MQLSRRFVTTLALCAALGNAARAQSHGMMMHHGVPSRVLVDQRVGPYVASVWIERDVGEGAVYVMLDAADGLAFTPPSTVRVSLVPASGRLGEVMQVAHFEPMRKGSEARYVAKVMFDRPDRWKLRVIIDGVAGGGQLVSQVTSTSNAATGPFGVFLGSIPFVLAALVYGRAWRAKNAGPRT